MNRSAHFKPISRNKMSFSIQKRLLKDERKPFENDSVVENFNKTEKKSGFQNQGNEIK